jgi:hypothetical protein
MSFEALPVLSGVFQTDGASDGGFIFLRLRGIHLPSSAGLRGIHLPSSVEFIGESCFSKCKSFRAMTIDAGSKLSRFDYPAFQESGLKVIDIPASVEVICELCFSHCQFLESVTFPPGSRLSRIEREAFSWSGLRSPRLK